MTISQAILTLVILLPLTLWGFGHCTEPSSASSVPARVELGRYLFYDRQLSANGTISCGSCHIQQLAFADNQPTSLGVTGERLRRNTPSLLNVGQLGTLNWANPGLTSLEQQIEGPLFAEHPPEMGIRGHEDEVLTRLRADRAYALRFAAAFPGDPDPLQWPRLMAALATFVRTLEARNSPYDRFLYADEHNALSSAAQRGMRLFFSHGLACGHCHTDIVPPDRVQPPRWADLPFVSTGAGRNTDTGLAEVTGLAHDVYRFRTPPLRNVAVTAPYMHDGSLATLDAVVRFYESAGQQGVGHEPERKAARHALIAGFSLSDADRADLIVFLKALTDQDALINPKYANPFID